MSDRGEYRSCFTAMADDPDIHAMTPAAFKLFWMLKLSLPATGIGVVYPSTLCDQVGVERAQLDACFAELEAAKPGSDQGWIVRDRNVVWIVNGLRYEPHLTPTNVRKHVPFVRRLLAELNAKLPIVGAFKAHYPEWFEGESNTNRKSIDRVSSNPKPPENGKGIDSVSIQKPSLTKPSLTKPNQPSGDLDQERRARTTVAAPLHEALANLPKEAIAFLKQFYPRGKASVDRRVDVAEQILATLANGTELRDGAIVRAYSPERLAKKCREVIHSHVHDPDKAIVILLQKLGDTSDHSAPGIAEAKTAADDQRRAEREAAGDLMRALRWLEHEPDVATALHDELASMGMIPEIADEALDDKLLLYNRRITRQALILAAWRRAGEPDAASDGAPDPAPEEAAHV